MILQQSKKTALTICINLINTCDCFIVRASLAEVSVNQGAIKAENLPPPHLLMLFPFHLLNEQPL